MSGNVKFGDTDMGIRYHTPSTERTKMSAEDTRCSSTAASGSCEHSSTEASKEAKKARRNAKKKAKWREMPNEKKRNAKRKKRNAKRKKRNAKRKNRNAKRKEEKEKALEVALHKAYDFWGIDEITRIVLSILAPKDSASVAATCKLLSVSCAHLSRKACCITAGSFHTVVATKSGAVLSWGGGPALGYAVDSRGLFSQQIPRAVTALSNKRIVLVSSTDEHVAAVTSNNEVWTWGSNAYGQLGHGTKENAVEPKRVEALDRIPADKVIADYFYTFIVTVDGDLLTCGLGKHGVLGFTDTQNKLVPERVDLYGHKVQFVTMCPTHAVAVTKTGLVFTWGQGRDGVLGHGDIKDSFLPKLVDALCPEHIVKVAVGNALTMALTATGVLFSWGASRYSLGNGDKLPTRVSMLRARRLRDISARGDHIFATEMDGRLLGWGKSGYASGLKCSMYISDILVPRRIPTYKERVEYVACGAFHTAILCRSKRIFTCGEGSRGQLGRNTLSSHYDLEAVPYFN